MPDRRVILITGATGGLGRAIARRFGRAGSRIVVHYRSNKEAAEKLTAEIEGQGAEAMAFQADVRSLSEMQAMARAAVDRWNRLDVLIANAAVRKDGLLLRTSEEDWESVVETNLTGVWNSLMAVRDPFLRQGQGQVIAIGSVTGAQGRSGQVNYAASKAGLTGLIRSAAKEWAPHRIQLNIIFPGLQATGMTSGLSPERREAIERQGLLDHSPPIDQVADFIYFLSNMTGVSGQIFNLDSRIV
jgi:3-oxoacyl-[acyl-carrier protein] reductase